MSPSEMGTALRPARVDVLRRLDDVVWGSLLLVCAASSMVGAAMADQAGRQAMRLLGDQSFIGLEYPVLGVQEFCPLVTAIVLAQRVGAGFSAELSSLIADGTWDAQLLYNTRPVQRRVVPMAFALPLGTVVLGVVAVVVWELGGVLVMLLRSNINPFTFVHPEVVTPSLLALLCGKCLVFGVCIFAGSFSAALTTRDHGDIGRATTDAVVRGTLLCLLVNLLIDVAWFLA
ncbi:MAG: ABC transporter permease [Deltaproteobacteria bacterium]|nr:ABC transporter permease [Deltaproteobacteria bacterium]